MRRWMLVVLAVAVAGCAQAASDRGQAAGGGLTSGAVAPAPRTVAVTARDANRRVLLAIGDRLELRFPPTADTTWQLANWPARSLSLASRDDRTGHWTFVARAVGSGRVVLRPAGICRPPRLCPVAADDSIDGANPSIPGRGGVISIAVLVR